MPILRIGIVVAVGNFIDTRGAIKSMKAIWSITWGNPYTNPPDDFPEPPEPITVQWNKGDDTRHPAEFIEFVDKYDGYCIGWASVNEKPRKYWGEETKKRVRLGRLTKRIQKKYGLFAEEELKREIERYKKIGYL